MGPVVARDSFWGYQNHPQNQEKYQNDPWDKW
jgi:hypothetical protein